MKVDFTLQSVPKSESEDTGIGFIDPTTGELVVVKSRQSETIEDAVIRVLTLHGLWIPKGAVTVGAEVTRLPDSTSEVNEPSLSDS